MAKPSGVGEILTRNGTVARRIYFWCRSCGATEDEERLIEVGYPGVAQAGDEVVVVITREIVCENCLACHDALLDLARMDSTEVPN